jgi:hypothetical protein
MRYALGGDVMLLRDPYVNHMSKIYRSLNEQYERAAAASCPEAYGAYLLNSRCSYSKGAKWQVEACMMAGADNDYLQKILPMPCGADTYDFYRKIYFDVDDCLGSVNTVLSTVLGYSSGVSDEYGDCDITWKMLAYTQGLEMFEQLLWHQAGGALSRSINDFLRDFQQSRKLYYGYHIVQNAKLCFKEQLLPILQLADQRSHGAGAEDSEEHGQAQQEARFERCVRHILGGIDISLRNRNNAELPLMPAAARQRLLQPSELVHA